MGGLFAAASTTITTTPTPTATAAAGTVTKQFTGRANPGRQQFRRTRRRIVEQTIFVL